MNLDELPQAALTNPSKTLKKEEYSKEVLNFVLKELRFELDWEGDFITKEKLINILKSNNYCPAATVALAMAYKKLYYVEKGEDCPSDTDDSGSDDSDSDDSGSDSGTDSEDDSNSEEETAPKEKGEVSDHPTPFNTTSKTSSSSTSTSSTSQSGNFGVIKKGSRVSVNIKDGLFVEGSVREVDEGNTESKTIKIAYDNEMKSIRKGLFTKDEINDHKRLVFPNDIIRQIATLSPKTLQDKLSTRLMKALRLRTGNNDLGTIPPISSRKAVGKELPSDFDNLVNILEPFIASYCKAFDSAVVVGIVGNKLIMSLIHEKNSKSDDTTTTTTTIKVNTRRVFVGIHHIQAALILLTGKEYNFLTYYCLSLYFQTKTSPKYFNRRLCGKQQTKVMKFLREAGVITPKLSLILSITKPNPSITTIASHLQYANKTDSDRHQAMKTKDITKFQIIKKAYMTTKEIKQLLDKVLEIMLKMASNGITEELSKGGTTLLKLLTRTVNNIDFSVDGILKIRDSKTAKTIFKEAATYAMDRANKLTRTCEHCKYQTTSSSSIKSHQSNNHFICGIKKCVFKGIDNADLATHQSDNHSINPLILFCGIGECPYQTKTSSNIKQHQSNIHFKCGIKGCVFKGKDKATLATHKAKDHPPKSAK